MSQYNPYEYWNKINSTRKSEKYLVNFFEEINTSDRSAIESLSSEHIQRHDQLMWLKENMTVYEMNRILDAGCGPGFWFQLWHELNLRATGVDLAPTSRERALSMSKFLGEEYPVYDTSLDNLPFPNNYFDVACTIKVLLHVPAESITNVMREIGRVANMLFLIELETGRKIKTREHVFQHDYTKLADELGYSIEQRKYAGNDQTFYVIRT
jgi:SAM-dependent methyltransferase